MELSENELDAISAGSVASTIADAIHAVVVGKGVGDDYSEMMEMCNGIRVTSH